MEAPTNLLPLALGRDKKRPIVSLTDHDNVAKWYNWWRSLTKWQQILVVVILLIGLGWWLHSRSLRKDLNSRESSIVDLRARNAELHRENLHLRALLDPVRIMAQQLYPQMESDAAIAKLAENLEQVRELATSAIYRPLSSERKRALTDELSVLLRVTPPCPKAVKVFYDGGNRNRALIANDLVLLLSKADYSASGPQSILSLTAGSGVLPPVTIYIHPDDTTNAQGLIAAVNSLFNTQAHVKRQEKRTKGTADIHIHGEPLFTDDGVMVVR